MKIFSSKKRVAAIGVMTAATVVGGGVAYAYWTSTGEGVGSASTGDSVLYDVAFATTTGGPLSPNGPSQSTGVTVTNLGTGAQQVTSVQVKVANPDGTAWSSGTCSAADFSLNSAAAGAAVEVLPADATLAAGASTPSLPVSIQMIDTGNDQEDCKNVPVPLYAAAS